MNVRSPLRLENARVRQLKTMIYWSRAVIISDVETGKRRMTEVVAKVMYGARLLHE